MSRPLLLLAAAWIAWFALHSLLASFAVKRRFAHRWPRAAPGYRLLYNALALALLVPPAWLVLTWQGPLLWSWDGPLAWLAHGAAALALGGFAWTLRYYDGGEFLGTRQWRQPESAHGEAHDDLHLSPLHRQVRHPWYALALLLIWTRDMDAARLLSALLVTGYFVIGSYLEERKLLRVHGPAYTAYRAEVPGLLPRPGRSLDPQRARELEDAARDWRRGQAVAGDAVARRRPRGECGLR